MVWWRRWRRPRSVEGIRWRRLNRTHRDAVAALTRRSDITDGARYPNDDPILRLGLRSPFFVAMGGFASGLLVAVMVDELGRRTSIEGHVDPVYRGRGLGAAMLDWALAEARGAPTVVQTRSLTPDKQQLFESRGLRECAAVDDLSMPLSSPVEPTPFPPGIAVTDWDAEDGYYLYTEEPANPFALFEEPGESFEVWREDTTGPYLVESCSLIARTSDGAPVAFVSTSESGPIQIGVVPAWRRRCLGRALVTLSTARLYTFPERA